MSRCPIYAGSFDPITNGHLSVVRRTAGVFGRVCILIAVNPDKYSRFTMEERLDLAQESVKEYGVKGEVFFGATDGMVADWCDSYYDVLIRGIRRGHEVKYEQKIADFNRGRTGIETIWLPAEPDMSEISSSALKVMVENELPAEKFCTPSVLKAFQAKIGGR